MSLESGALARVGVGDVFMSPFRVFFGAVHGACTPGGVALPVEEGLKGAFAKTSNIVAAETARGVSAFGAVNANYAATQGMGIKGGLGHMGKTLSALGPRGMIVAGGVALLGALAVGYGAKLARHAQHLLGQGSRFGDIPDAVNSSGFHGARLLSGLGMVGGGLLCLVPGGATLGIPLIATSTATSAGLGVVRWSQQPDNFMNSPNVLADKWPLNLPGQAFNQASI